MILITSVNNSFTIDIDTSVNEDYDYDLSKIETEEMFSNGSISWSILY